MSRYRLLAIDVDGTLLNSRNELTDATRDAVLRAKRAGIEIVLATGRRYSRVLPLVEPLELNVPLVTASGALIKRAADHRTLYRAEFLPARSRRACAWYPRHATRPYCMPTRSTRDLTTSVARAKPRSASCVSFWRRTRVVSGPWRI